MTKKKAEKTEPVEATIETPEATGPYLNSEDNQALDALIEQIEEPVAELTETPPGDGVTEEPTEISADEETEELVTDEPAETSPEEEGAAEEEHTVKTVPHEAFHAEREKRKEAQRREKEILQGYRDVSEELKSLKAKRQDEIDQTPIDDYEVEIRKNRKEIAELKEQNQQSQKLTQAEAQRRADKQLADEIKQVDSDLSKEGLPGFEALARVVEGKISKKLQSDPEFRAVYDSDPVKVWKDTYRDDVYPEARKVFVEQDKNRLFEEKKKLKAEANLNTNPGKKTEKKPEKTKTEFTYEDYQKEQAEYSKEREAGALW
jgi:hypothetical protein